MQPTVSDLKYEGVATSRSRIFEDDDGDHSDGDGDSDSGSMDDDERSDKVTDRSEDDSAADKKEDTPDRPHEPKNASSPTDTSAPAQDLTSSLKHTRDLDRLKGQAVSKQLVRLSHRLFSNLEQISCNTLASVGFPS